MCEEEATGAGAGGGRDAELKTRTPHKDVGIYHLALFTFKGVFSTKSTACLFFEEIICTAAMPARSAMTAFTCSSDCNLKTLSVTMSEPSSSAVTLPMTRCTLPSHMLKRIACCKRQKASTRKCLGNGASTATTFSYCDDLVIPRARLNDLGFLIFCPHQHSDIAGKNCRGSQLDTEAREQQVLMRASDWKHHLLSGSQGPKLISE